jgi:predicted transcriptional regulator
MAYLPVLVEKGLVSVNSRLYATTEKGEEWLRIFGAMEEAMK